MLAPLIYVASLANLPPVPSLVPIYKGTSTTTTNETTSTWTGIDIGVAHPKRIIILSVFHGVADAATATVNGIDHCHRTQDTAHNISIFAIQVPSDTIGIVTVSAVSSVRKAVSVYVAYPENHLPMDFGTDAATLANDAVVADQKAQVDGFLIYAGAQLGTLGAFGTTWGGTESVTEDVDAQLEATSSYTMGNIQRFTVSSDLNDVTLAETVSGAKRLAVTTWGPPKR
jgi:hypothetical protein